MYVPNTLDQTTTLPRKSYEILIRKLGQAKKASIMGKKTFNKIRVYSLINDLYREPSLQGTYI